MSTSLLAAPCVGRKAEIAVVRTAVRAAAGGTPSVVVVLGEAGIGKSTLLAAALDGLHTVEIWVSGDELETDLEYGLVEQLVRMATRGRSVSEPLAANTPSDSLEAGRQLLAALDELAERGPVTVVVDDAHLADSVSLDALTFAARRLAADQVAVVVAARSPDRLPAGLLRLAERTGGRVDLEGLTAPAIGELASHTYGRPVPLVVAERLRNHTGGSPLHARVLVEQVRYESLLGPGDLPSPRSFAPLVMSRLAQCPEPSRRIAEALAVFGSAASVVDVAQAAGLDDPRAAVDHLVDNLLVRVDVSPGGPVLSFPHGLVRACIYDDMSLARRAELHTAAAAVTPADASLRHRLLAARGPDAELAKEAEAAAEREMVRGARAFAAQHFFGAANVAVSRADRERLLLAAAEQLQASGHPLGEWADEIAQFSPSARRDLCLGRRVMNTGRFDDARPVLLQAWQQAQADIDESSLLGSIAELLAIIAISTLRADEVLHWSRQALECGSESLSATLVCHGLALGGRLGEAQAEMNSLLAFELTARGEIDARLGRAIVAVWSNEVELAIADLQVAIGSGHDEGLLPYVNACAYLAEAVLRDGRPQESLDMAEECLAVINDADAPWLSPLPLGTAAFALAVLGRVEEARERVAIADAIANATGQIPAHIWVQHARLRIAVNEQDHPTVAAIGDRMLADGWDVIPEGVHHWRAAYVDALLAEDRIADAVEASAQLDAAASDGDTSVATDAARARAAIASATGADASAELDVGLALDPVRARPFERARIELDAGKLRRRAGQRTEASRLLRSAADRFAALGAMTWLERCERELAACGLTPVKRSAHPAAPELSGQERVVARLVAAGHTNREVATELIISVKTVEHHLSRIYAKLGVRSRTQLAAQLRPESSEPR